MKKPLNIKSERGSLALEQILFVGAVVAMFAGITAFYDNIGEYFAGVEFAAPPQNIGGHAPTGSDVGS